MELWGRIVSCAQVCNPRPAPIRNRRAGCKPQVSKLAAIRQFGRVKPLIPLVSTPWPETRLSGSFRCCPNCGVNGRGTLPSSKHAETPVLRDLEPRRATRRVNSACICCPNWILEKPNLDTCGLQPARRFLIGAGRGLQTRAQDTILPHNSVQLSSRGKVKCHWARAPAPPRRPKSSRRAKRRDFSSTGFSLCTRQSRVTHLAPRVPYGTSAK